MSSFRHPQLHIFKFYLHFNTQEPLPLRSLQISFFKWKETSLNSCNNSSEPASWYVPHILYCFVSFLWTGSSWFPFVTHTVPSTVPCIWWWFDKCILHWMKKKTLSLPCKHWGTQRSGGLWWVEPIIKVACVYCLLICTSHFLLNSLHSGFYSHRASSCHLCFYKGEGDSFIFQSFSTWHRSAFPPWNTFLASVMAYLTISSFHGILYYLFFFSTGYCFFLVFFCGVYAWLLNVTMFQSLIRCPLFLKNTYLWLSWVLVAVRPGGGRGRCAVGFFLPALGLSSCGTWA